MLQRRTAWQHCTQASLPGAWRAGFGPHPLPCALSVCARQVHSLVEAANVVRPDWNGYNIMHDSAGRVAALDLGFLPGPNAAQAPTPKLVWLLNSDDFDAQDVPDDAFVVYQVRVGMPARLLPPLMHQALPQVTACQRTRLPHAAGGAHASGCQPGAGRACGFERTRSRR